MKRKWILGLVLGCSGLFVAAQARADVNTDKAFLAKASQGDYNEIQLSKLAISKTTNPDVKAFAEKMVREHTELEAKMKPFADKWGVPPATGFDADHQAIYDKLNGLSGPDFDKEYMKAMDDDHHKALDAFNDEVGSTQNAKFKATVEQGKSAVSAHTHMADSLAAKVGS
jgi:putative membrane protein